MWPDCRIIIAMCLVIKCSATWWAKEDLKWMFVSYQESLQKDRNVEEEEMIRTDLSKLSKKQKLALFQKESPEFFSLVEDFKGKVCL